jgi:hypothetical protein
MDNNQVQSGGIGVGGLLLVVFITLKLCGVIAWSWWWVLAPMWVPLVFAFVILLLIGIVFLIAWIASGSH